VAFILRERRCEHPMLDLRLFHRARFSAGIISGLLSYLVMFGVLFLVPFYLERCVGLGSGRAGLELMVMPVALGATAPIAGRLADHVGARPLTVGGMVGVAGGLTLLAVFRPETWVFLVLLAIVGVGMGAFTPPNNATIMGSVPADQAGVASGVLNMTRGMGTSLGLAVTGLIFEATGGSSDSSGAVAHAFSTTCLALAGVAVAAGLIAGTSEGGPIAVPVGVMVE
jgi:predicted MFS family arabinose efflux permease